MNSLEMLTRFGHVEPADRAVLDAAAMAVLDPADGVNKPARRSRRGSRRPRRVLVGAVGVAAAAAFTVAGLSLSTNHPNHEAGSVAMGTGHVPTRRSPLTPSTPADHMEAPTGKTILTRLASVVRAAPAPAGDATLVIRSQVNGGTPILGADLYTDGGKYYYASAESGLPAQVTAGNDQGDGVFGREIAAAEQPAGTSSLTSASETTGRLLGPPFPLPSLGRRGGLVEQFEGVRSGATTVRGRLRSLGRLVSGRWGQPE
jgi:hypothetical protein